MHPPKGSSAAPRPRVAVYKLASCDGCQLTLLNCEDELLAVAAAIDIVQFAEATSRPDDGGRFDLAIVEGSVTTEEQLEHLRHVRARADKLVAIGACATSGGIQALRNWADVGEMARAVYAHPEYIQTLATSTPASAHGRVDFELRGCPIDKGQLVELLAATLVGRRPQIRDESVCLDCKRQGTVCVTVAHGTPCLGPATHPGGGAICPRFDRGCFGCFGPKERPNTASLALRLRELGLDEAAVQRWFRAFTAGAPAFREESERHEHR